MTKIIFIAGSPGSGKTTISKILHEKLKDSVLIELSWLRGFHLDSNWSNASKKEENMSFLYIINILSQALIIDLIYMILTILF
jgi:uridine kinase